MLSSHFVSFRAFARVVWALLISSSVVAWDGWVCLPLVPRTFVWDSWIRGRFRISYPSYPFRKVYVSGIGPYITSSIIFQILTTITPSLKALAAGEEGEAGREKYKNYIKHLGDVKERGLGCWWVAKFWEPRCPANMSQWPPPEMGNGRWEYETFSDEIYWFDANRTVSKIAHQRDVVSVRGSSSQTWQTAFFSSCV